ncbi:MAG: MFS transporter [Caldilineaceae bacterium]
MISNLENSFSIQWRSQQALWLAGFSHFALELCHSFMPVLYPLLVVSMGLSYTQVGVLTLAISLTSSLLQPFLSTLSDRFGAGRVATVSILWLGLLMGIVSLAPNYIALIVLLTLASFGSSAYHPAGAEIAASSGSARRGLSMSVFSVGGNIGAAVSPLLIGLTVGSLGIHAGFSIIPFALLSSALLYSQFGRLSANKSHVKGTSPHQVGTGYRLGLIMVVVSAMTRAWFQVSLTTYLPAWVESNGGTLAHGGQMLSLLLFSLGIGSMLGGPLSDRFGAWLVVLVNTLLIAPFYWLFLSTTGLTQLFFLLLIGITMGTTYPTAILMAQDAWPQRTAFAAAVVMGWGWVPGGLGASFTGYIADQSGLNAALYLLITPPLIGALCILGYRRFKNRG